MKKNNKKLSFDRVFPFILFIVLSFIVLIFVLNLKNKEDIKQESSQGSLEVDIPREEITLERKSQECVLESSDVLPLNWPNDLPNFDEHTKINSSCLENQPNRYIVELVIKEPYSYLTFAISQDIKMLGWDITNGPQELNPNPAGTIIEAKKESRLLHISFAPDNTSSDSPATLIVVEEIY